MALNWVRNGQMGMNIGLKIDLKNYVISKMFADGDNDVYWEQILQENLAKNCLKMAKMLAKMIGTEIGLWTFYCVKSKNVCRSGQRWARLAPLKLNSAKKRLRRLCNFFFFFFENFGAKNGQNDKIGDP